MTTAAIPSSQLGAGTGVHITVVPDAEAMQRHFEDDVIGLLEAAARTDGSLVAVFPVGPVQFRSLAARINRLGLNLHRFHAFFMDEFCDADGQWVPESHPMSLRRFALREFVSQLDPALGLTATHVHVPDPKCPQHYDEALEAAGGADVVYTGFGINGHWAFNDPDESGNLSEEEFAQLPTRVVRLSVATMVQTAMGGTGGDLEGIPPRAVTIGMRQLLAARAVHGYFPRTWHSAVVRRALHGPVTPSFPGSYIQRHPNVMLTLPQYVADPPELIVTQKL